MIVSHAAFMWVCSFMLAGLAGAWLIYDSILLRRHLRRGREVRDQIFGSIVGVTIAVLGIGAIILLHLDGVPEPTHCLPDCAALFFNGP